MDISGLTLKLIILLIPGGIGSIVLERLTDHKPWTPFKFVLNSILIGFFSYAIEALVVYIFRCPPLTIWSSIGDKTIIPYSEVAYATLAGIILGIFFTIAHVRKWLNKSAKWLKISQKYGDVNLFSYFLSSKDIQYVYIRNPKQNLTYWGYVEAISESEGLREVILANASVYR